MLGDVALGNADALEADLPPTVAAFERISIRPWYDHVRLNLGQLHIRGQWPVIEEVLRLLDAHGVAVHHLQDLPRSRIARQ